MKIALGYIRCSSDEQTQDSVPRQRAEIERWAQTNGYMVREFFIDDGVSGTIPLGERQAGSKLIEEIERTKDTQYVIIWEYSRWGRDADAEQIYFWELYINRLGVKLISLDNPELTFKPAMERGIMRFVQRQTSSQENKSKSLRSYSGGRRNIELGYLNTNTPPYGYVRAAKNLTTAEIRILREGETVQKRLEKPFLSINEGEATIINRIFEMRASGTSIHRIAQILNEESVPSPKGKRWRKNVLNRMIANPAYYGAACWGKTTSSRILAYENGQHVPSKIKKYSRPIERSQWVINEQAGIPLIVSKEVWQKANAVRLVEQKHRGKSSLSQYLLSGLVFDELSGSAMVGSDGGHYRRKDNTMTKKRYYVNNNWHSQGVLVGLRSVDAELLEQKVIRAIREDFTNPTLLRKVETLVSRYSEDKRKLSDSGNQLRRIDQKIEEKDKAIKNLLTAIQRANDIETLLPALRAVEKEKKALESEKAMIAGAQMKVSAIPSPKEMGRLVAEFFLRFEQVFPQAPIEEKKQLIRQWVNRIDVLERNGKKVAKAMMNLLPKSGEFKLLYEESVLSGPCRTRTYDPRIMSPLL